VGWRRGLATVTDGRSYGRLIPRMQGLLGIFAGRLHGFV